MIAATIIERMHGQWSSLLTAITSQKSLQLLHAAQEIIILPCVCVTMS